MTVLFTASWSYPQQTDVSGTVYFTDGTRLEFTNIRSLEGSLPNGERITYGEFNVFHEGVWREVPFSSLSEIEVIRHERIVRDPYLDWHLYNAVLRVTLKSGLSVSSTYGHLVYVVLDFSDVLTGEHREYRRVMFTNTDRAGGDWSLHIKRIVFN
jgi:hypothetical protein